MIRREEVVDDNEYGYRFYKNRKPNDFYRLKKRRRIKKNKYDFKDKPRFRKDREW